MERFSFLHDHVLTSVLGLTFHLSPFSGQREEQNAEMKNSTVYSGLPLIRPPLKPIPLEGWLHFEGGDMYYKADFKVA